MNTNYQLREKIISLLKMKGSLYLGDIIREVSLSPQTGYKFIQEMKEEGIVRQQADSLKITLV
ncbi:MAG: hypothetical protein H6538_02550 [Bacteroidales bacterium]|nr:hypothetical protein [Bacteroidales bacterium]MCB8999259.1 hypothetical protein [Bacteroidales bacterium]MCB9013073.1 hypothetical protein [Bacteroidales bacterium]